MIYLSDIEFIEEKLQELKIELTGHPRTEKPDFMIAYCLSENIKDDFKKLSSKLFKENWNSE